MVTVEVGKCSAVARTQRQRPCTLVVNSSTFIRMRALTLPWLDDAARRDLLTPDPMDDSSDCGAKESGCFFELEMFRVGRDGYALVLLLGTRPPSQTPNGVAVEASSELSGSRKAGLKDPSRAPSMWSTRLRK
jgi:hypothetical protein